MVTALRHLREARRYGIMHKLFQQKNSASRCLFIFGGILAYFISIDQFYGMWTGILLVIVSPVLLIFQIEKQLKRRFPKT